MQDQNSSWTNACRNASQSRNYYQIPNERCKVDQSVQSFSSPQQIRLYAENSHMMRLVKYLYDVAFKMVRSIYGVIESTVNTSAVVSKHVGNMVGCCFIDCDYND
jgi:ferritin